ncbi:MAG TPA: hypothetical protein VFQ16_15610 [Burkholderiaceae bacterium]|nr:hypothetical protein [Burkholderiaceae bacterium]
MPTLTEVIELASEPRPLDAAPASAESVPIEEVHVAAVIARLQPLIEAWVDARVRALVGSLQGQWARELADQLAKELHAALPELVSQAMQPGAEAPRRPR